MVPMVAMSTPMVMDDITRMRATRNDIGMTQSTMSAAFRLSAFSCFNCRPHGSLFRIHASGSQWFASTNGVELTQSA